MQCPQCNNDVPVTEAQYGALYTCSKCMAVYFVNFDGTPEYGDMSLPPPELEPTNEEQVEVNQNGDVQLQSPVEDLIANPTLESPIENFDNNLVSLPDFSLPEQPMTSEFMASAAAVMAETKVPADFSSVAREITDYGNQEEVVSQISYDLFIKGLDTKEVKQAFKEAIDDSKFGWITADVFNQIKNGEFSLKNLNSIQAFVLAQRIQFLDLDIEWKQNVAF